MTAEKRVDELEHGGRLLWFRRAIRHRLRSYFQAG